MSAGGIQLIVDALSVGGLYALTALGIGLIFSVMRLGNFAHSEFITVAAYVLFALSGNALVMSIAAAVLVAMALAVLTEFIAFRPLRNADPATLLISSFTVSMFLQRLMIFLLGSRPKALDPLPMLNGSISFGGAQLSTLKLATILTCAILLATLTLFLTRTRFGLQMRAAAENFTMSRLLGVRANVVIAASFAISGVLAAAVAILFSAQTGFVHPRFGVQLVIIAFVATVIGGLGNLIGAAVGGFLVGVVTILLQALLPEEFRPFREAFLFAVVILVLLFRPQGLLPAKNLRERV